MAEALRVVVGALLETQPVADASRLFARDVPDYRASLCAAATRAVRKALEAREASDTTLLRDATDALDEHTHAAVPSSVAREIGVLLRHHLFARFWMLVGDGDVRIGDGTFVELDSRPRLAAVVEHVARVPRRGATPGELLEVAWAGVKGRRKSLRHRVHNEVSELRALGVGVRLRRGRYILDARTILRVR